MSEYKLGNKYISQTWRRDIITFVCFIAMSGVKRKLCIVITINTQIFQ